MDFAQSHYDYSLFTKRIGADLVVILVYVDDLLVTGSNLLLIQQVRKDLQEKFKMKDLGELKYFLGIEFPRSQEDIAFVVQVLSQYMHVPMTSHMEAAGRIMKYIKSTPRHGLFMPTGSCNKLIAYCDSDWEKSKKQGTISRSLAEAEFRSMTTTIAEIAWLVGLFKEFGVDIALHVSLCCDSKATIWIAAHPIFHERTKHVDIDCHFVREKLVQGLIQTQHIGTT
uniref:Uncharacterized mitochondrial protein AtMg00810-like n=1 Tax=Nicotiana tabacum TaxID=4097 RepID=A0A1S3ZRM3_TOBAC|nr:PREDICTED: uncharacterized mitochondrial protein AtMg00810-like [Nicotiana tabacum]